MMCWNLTKYIFYNLSRILSTKLFPMGSLAQHCDLRSWQLGWHKHLVTVIGMSFLMAALHVEKGLLRILDRGVDTPNGVSDVADCTGALVHWDRDKMSASLTNNILKAFCWMQTFEFQAQFHSSMFPRVYLKICHYRTGDKPKSDPLAQFTDVYLCQSASMS